MNPKHVRFVEEYLVDLNATQAAIRAAYSRKTAGQQGERLLKNAEVAAAIAEGRKRLGEAAGITAARVLQEYGRIARSDIRRVMQWGDAVAVRDAETGEDRITNGIALRGPDEISDDDAAAISEVSLTREGLRVKLYPKQPALDALARHLGLNDRRAQLALPDTTTAEGCAGAVAAILERVAAGELTIEQGQGLTAIIETRRRTIETAELAAEVARLKALVETKDGNGRT